MLDIQQATVKFADSVALNGLTLRVEEGKVFGLLGPNGAGKTTLIRSLMGLQHLSAGSIRLFGDMLPGSASSRTLIGYMPQLYAIYDQLTVRENVRFFAELYSVPSAQINDRVDELLHMTELDSKADAILHTLSGGMKRRAMMATALVHKPRLLILDEPTAGVDPILRIKFWQWFRKLCDQGTSILVTTHHINEAEQCDDIVFLRAGTMIGHGTPQQLMDEQQVDNLDQVFIRLAEQTEVQA
jgi:ABC-2 type transport system ATP-binding protein